MTKEELITALQAIPKWDVESAHCTADDLLIAYINDSDITGAYEGVPKWYA